jgi:hypothetical protein
MTAAGQTRRFELSWHVGFTPDSGRIAARQRTDASGQQRTQAVQQLDCSFDHLVGEHE